jgi:hypothetical protein
MPINIQRGLPQFNGRLNYESASSLHQPCCNVQQIELRIVESSLVVSGGGSGHYASTV